MQIQHSSCQVGLVVHLTQNLRLRGRPLPIILARIVRPMNALQLCHDSFHTAVTDEALRAIIGWKSAISFQWGSVDPKIQVEGVAPHQPFYLLRKLG